MKIVQEGLPLTRVSSWWTGQDWHCGTCKCVFRMEEEDQESVYTQDFASYTVAFAKCPNPTCLADVQIRRLSPWDQRLSDQQYERMTGKMLDDHGR